MTGKVSVLSSLRVAGALVLDDAADFPANPGVGTMVIKQQALYAYLVIGGATNWYPLVKMPNSYSHDQTAPALEWVINHNLASNDIWYQVQDDNGQLMTASDVEFVDNNTLRLVFLEAVQGKVLVLSSGLDGAQGLEGDSAYQVAVNNGFVGTEAQWLESLQGADGLPGTGINAELQGVRHVMVDKGTVASGTVNFVVTEANWQRLQVGGALTIQATGFTAGKYSELGLKLVNAGSAALTWTNNIKWVKSDGTFTTTFADLGITLQAAGTDFVYMWSDDGGTNVYAKVLR